MLNKNKRGSLNILLIVLIIIGFIVMLVLGITSWAFSLVDEQLSSIDFDIGNSSWNETYSATLKIGITSMTTRVPVIISTGVLLGMIFLMLIVAYNTDGKNKLWIMVDILFIIVAEILAWVISENFLITIGLTPELLDVFSNTLTSGSKYIINLPIIIPVMGALVILATYVFNKTKPEPIREF